MSEANFNSIAGIYDLLAFLVFWNKIKTSQKYFLKRIKENSEVLILGGGTGFILEYLSELNIHLNVTYIDNSSKMTGLAEKRKINNKMNVKFILGNESDIPGKKYDSVLAGFFLDLFESGKLKVVIEKIGKILSEKGELLVTDFRFTGKGTVFQRVLSLAMHKFFKVFCDIGSEGLKDIDSFLLDEGFVKDDVKYFYNDFIFSAVYSKK